MSSTGRSSRLALVVSGAQAGLRLDQFLAAAVPDLSRRRARTLLDIGGVFVDGKRCKVAGRTLHEGQKITVFVGGALERATHDVGTAARAADAARLPPYQIVFEDADLLVVDKPAGLLTAPTPEGDRNTLSDLLARRGGAGRRESIFVVHRIDLQTSGLLVFARNEAANRVLAERFRVHDIERVYLAVVAGRFPDEITRIEKPIAGRAAVTNVSIEERFGQRATRLRVRLETGRTHQIRIHCASVGHPVLGDDRDHPGPDGSVRRVEPPGERVAGPPRMALHAHRLGFSHPRTAAPMTFESAWPADLDPWTAALRFASTRA